MRRDKVIGRKKRLTVTDIIGNEVEQWKQGEIITIEAGTGVGKSYFIKNTLYEKAKREGTKILFLLNRTRLKDQFTNEIKQDNKEDTIDIVLYQSIESVLRRNETYRYESYKYIVSDEFHYFLTESKFNKYTEDSFKNIVEDNNRIRVFMSATADATIEYFQKIGIDHRMYKIENSATNIRSLSFYRSEEVLEEFLSSIKKENKAIVFTKSATRAYELHKKYSDSVFVCSETGKSAYKRYVKKDKVEEMLNSEMFKEQFLFTTSTLDNGINFKDKSIKYIICDIEDIDTLIQCIGRKRSLNGHDKVNIIVKNITNKEIYRKKKLAEELIEPALYLKNHDTAMYIRKYSKNDEASSNRLIYDRNIGDSLEYEKVVNEIKLYKIIYDIKIYDKLLSEENGFMNYLQDRLQQYSVSVIDDHCKITGLYDYLDNIVGERLYKEEQKELISKIGLRDNYNRIQKSCDSLNSYFRNNKMPYHLRDKNRDGNRKLLDGSANPKFNKTYWTLAKHIC